MARVPIHDHTSINEGGRLRRVDLLGGGVPDAGASDVSSGPSGVPGGGAPATTVTDETTFGIASAVGTDTEYARQDHTHGSPANPASAHIADATDAHDASAISVLDTAANFIGTDVEAVLAELSDDIAAGGIPATIVDAKGDLIAATAADTVARLAAAANGAALITASGEATGLKWRLNNDAATAAPTANDDSGDGYSVGSRWIDTTNDKEYVCLDATATAAVWTETTAAGSGLPHGSSFPGSPATNDFYVRDDLDGIIFQYDGARWLCTCPHEMVLKSWQNQSASDSLTNVAPIPFGAAFDIWMVELQASMDAVSGLSGSAYYTITLSKYEGITPSAIASVSDQSESSNTFVIKKAAIGSALGATADALSCQLARVNSPGAFYGAAALQYRLIGPA